jgi:hypothetical protein
MAFEELESEALLEVRDRLREGRLGKMELLGRPRDLPLFDDGDEARQLAKIELRVYLHLLDRCHPSRLGGWRDDALPSPGAQVGPDGDARPPLLRKLYGRGPAGTVQFWTFLQEEPCRCRGRRERSADGGR